MRMKGKTVSVLALIILLTSLFFATNLHLVKSDTRTWTVDDDGSADFSKIQEAINAAGELDTISVKNGTYRENIVINKILSLIGENREGTIIDADGAGNVVLIAADNVNFTGFTARNSGEWETGILLSSASNCRIANNMVSNSHFGIVLHRSINNTLRDNQLFENDYNFHVDAWTQNELINDVDSSNLVEGKPVCYWIERHDEEVPANAGNVMLVNCTNIKVAELHLTKNYYGILLVNTSSSTLTNNRIESNFYGINQWHSPNNTIIGNIVSENQHGIRIHYSDNNVVGFNEFESNVNGLTLSHSHNNTVRFNNMVGNDRNLRLLADPLSLREYIHNIEKSNVINNRPVYYLVNQNNQIIDSETTVGYLGVVNSTNIHVQNLSLSDNEHGILFAFTKNAIVEKSEVFQNTVGISLQNCDNIRLIDNKIIDNTEGIILSYSAFNTLTTNVVSNNVGSGISMTASTNNTIAGNSIIGNGHKSQSTGAGIELYEDSSDNKIYRNNLVNNKVQAYSNNFENIWDNGLEGNYWGNYAGADSNNDGIGDTSHILDLNNKDHYPLMGRFSSFDTSQGNLEIISNSTISDFEYFESTKTMRINASQMEIGQTTGFCRVCIPYGLLDVNEAAVIIDDGLTPVLDANYTLYDNGTHRWIYFAYSHSTRKIEIIPEYPVLLAVFLQIIASALAVKVYKRKSTNKSHATL